jgi:hypothetical protein
VNTSQIANQVLLTFLKKFFRDFSRASAKSFKTE